MKESERQSNDIRPPQKFSEDIHETMRESLRLCIRDVILELRAQHLAEGGNPMTHWDRIQAVIVSRAQQTAKMREWLTLCLKSLQIPSPNNSLSSAIERLKIQMDSIAWLPEPSKRNRYLLQLVENEAVYIMAIARRRAEDRKAMM